MATVYHQIGVTCSSVTHFPLSVLLLNDLWAWPDDGIRPRPRIDRRRYVPWRQLAPECPIDVVKNLGEFSCTECNGHGNDFVFIPTVKAETRHPVQGLFGKEFPSICNDNLLFTTITITGSIEKKNKS